MSWHPTDPWNLVKDDVERVLGVLKQLQNQWENALDADEEAWARNEIDNSIKNLEYDLVDLEETITRVKKDTNRFSGITDNELEARNLFVANTRSYITSLKKQISEAPQSGNSTRHKRNLLGINQKQQNKYAALEQEIQNDHKKFIQGHQQMQHDMIREQDDGLKEVSVAVGTIHDMSLTMQDELAKQKIQLEEFDEEITETTNRVSKAIRKVDDLINKADQKFGWWIIATLLIVLMILFVLLFVVP